MAKDLSANLDLNLLRTFIIIAQEQNLRKASERLFVTQPAVSHALQRLRNHFDDQLFIKTKHGLTATPYAEDLYQHLMPAMDSLSKALNNTQEFTPAELDGKIRIALAPQFLASIGSELFLKIHQAAPQLRVEIINWSTTTLTDIHQGETLLGINYDIENTSKELVRKELMKGEALVFIRKDHPFSGQVITPQEATQYGFACLIIPDRTEQMTDVEKIFALYGLTANICFRSTSAQTVLEVVKETDMLFPCVSDLFSYSHPDFRRISVKLEHYTTQYELVAFYPNKNNKDPLTLWVMGLVSELLTQRNSAAAS
ncbi:LysR family transcriptional regulator [Photobacterium sanguinicancri]|uniref:LysR family transcriptional regulator n=1 Tax=Photobacterium sanguinicancri TaxID=875932 RepID=UPI0026E478F1|nr:LysR family transcriptional regulator [Photobacterium sanguinicancri]MDO6497706.1 LysR family transcriptional regulator [Photobacterium sanguinicancri]